MRSLLPALFIASAFAQQPADRPLKDLPYSPSLDLTSLDRAVEPCQDFYRFACGGWIKNNPIPADESSWDVYSKLADDNLHFLWGILEDVARPNATRSPQQQKTGDYFAACMDEQSAERAGLAPPRPNLDRIEALASVKDLARLLAHLHLGEKGDGQLFGFGANQDFGDSSRVIAFATAGGLGLPERDYYLKTDAKSLELRKAYEAHIARMFVLLGESQAEAAGHARTVLTLETALAQASLPVADKRDPHKLFHKFTRVRLAALTPSFNWYAYLAEIGLPQLDEFNVTEPAFFTRVEQLLRTTPLPNWKTYLRWHVLHDSAPYLTKALYSEHFEMFGHKLQGIEQPPPRWKRCVRQVDRDLGEALGQVFSERTFTPETKARAVAMTREIEKAMEADIRELDWMTAATKTRALEKLHAIVNKIGYPDKWRDYSSLEIRPADFAGNAERATLFEARRQLNKIGRPLDRAEWVMTPPTINAGYDPQMNDITFPAGVLQPPLFDPRSDDAPNYGNTGATIGHELTHAFDDEGRQFDAKGNVRDWWTPVDAARFLERAKCVSDQYSKYVAVDDIRINSKLTLGEDVADLGGTMLALIAWRNATASQRLQPVDGFTPDQRFFIGMAQWACGNMRPEMKRMLAATDPHSPLQYRVNGVVSNLPDFAVAFGCKAGQPMVREKACRVW